MSEPLDLSGLGNIDFTPSWAKKDAGVTISGGRKSYDDDGKPSGDRGGRRDFGDRGPRRDSVGGDLRAPRRDFGEGREFREGGKPFAKKPFSDRGPRRDFGDRGPRRDFGDRGPRRDSVGGDLRAPRRDFGDRKPFGDRRPRFEERPRPLDAEIKILPETKALGTIIRKLQGDIHAYKLKDLAYFFLDNPSSILLKVTPRPAEVTRRDAASTEQASTSFFQCRACGFASTKEEEVIDHIVAAHIGEYYDSKEVEVEPPKGNFNCVAKCGLSGVLLGPPNIHEFAATVREMIRTKYPDMSEAQYRSHIEMVRDAEAIEEWRKSATKKTLFFAKGTADQEGAKGLTRTEAEGEFRRNYLTSMLDRPKNLMITAEQALKSPVKPLVWAVQDALEQERRAPYNIIFALRGAFHHRKLHFFRVNDARGQEFVTNVEYKEFDAEHAIPELAAMAKFVTEHPCCDLKELPEGEDAVKHLQWLVSTGHVVAFTNGVYSMVEKYPKYGPQWKKRQPAKPAAAEVKVEGEGEEKVKVEGEGEGEEKVKVEGEGEGEGEEKVKVEGECEGEGTVGATVDAASRRVESEAPVEEMKAEVVPEGRGEDAASTEESTGAEPVDAASRRVETEVPVEEVKAEVVPEGRGEDAASTEESTGAEPVDAASRRVESEAPVEEVKAEVVPEGRGEDAASTEEPVSASTGESVAASTEVAVQEEVKNETAAQLAE